MEIEKTIGLYNLGLSPHLLYIGRKNDKSLLNNWVLFCNKEQRLLSFKCHIVEQENRDCEELYLN